MGGANKASGSKSRSKWKEYTALATVPLVLVLGNSMLVPILPDMERQMKLTSLQSSMVITLFSIAAGLVIPVAGYLSDRFSRKAVIIPSLAIYGAAGILAGFGALWGSYAILIVSRAIQGIAAAGTAPIAMALVGDLYKDGEESEALGLIEASNGTGKVVSPIIGSLLALIVWYAPFFAFPLFCAASLLAVMFMLKEPSSNEKPVPALEYLRGIGAEFKAQGRWLIPAFVAGALGLFIMFGVLFYLSDVLEKAPYYIDGVAKGGVLAIPLLGLVVTAYLTGRVIKNNGRLMRILMVTGLALMAAALGCGMLGYNKIILLIALITISSIGTGLLLPCLNTLITGSVDRSKRGMITSLYSSLRFIGVAFGPPLFTWLTAVSVMLLFGIVSGLSVAVMIGVWLLVRPPAKSGDTAGTNNRK
ncbi:MFS transporter [Paenibacillus beijingensis]|uniref:MFS transporter n=1 Tax=Paenibacillus beijingensis TaxID=1126833 RepID=A0A0D5NR46_9BACL|nr:MFS transporter [Paenibacillus beijingensis]